MATAGKQTPQDWSYEGLFINGEWVKPQSGELEDIINPATEEVIGRAPVGSTEECGKALAAARKAFDEGPWPRMDRFERAKRLEDLHEALTKRQAEITEMVIAECGATRPFAPFHFMFPMQPGVDIRLDPTSDRARAGRCRFGDHAVQLPLPAQHDEDRTGAGGRLHGGPETLPVHASAGADHR